MPARKNRTVLSDRWKDGIQATKIMQRLLDHGDGVIELSSTQITAYDKVLKKLVPDLSAITADIEATHTVEKVQVEFIRPQNTNS